MGNLSKNFSKWEFACKCGCGFDTPDPKLIEALQKLRDNVKRKITITSGCRCQNHNDKIEGASLQSQHVKGKAVDIIIENMDVRQIKKEAEKIDAFKGIGLYLGRIHLDIREKKARWTVK